MYRAVLSAQSWSKAGGLSRDPKTFWKEGYGMSSNEPSQSPDLTTLILLAEPQTREALAGTGRGA